jgi:ribonuclease P/MRP protein subunit POP5
VTTVLERSPVALKVTLFPCRINAASRAKAHSLAVIYFSPATSTAIIRVLRDHVRLLWAALSFVTKLPKPFDDPCVVHVVRNSGTIRLAEEEAIKRAKIFVRRARSSNETSGLDTILANAVATEERESAAASRESDEMSIDE